MRRPFLFLSSRAEDVVADDEYAAYLSLTGLADDAQLRRVRMEAEPLPELDLSDYSGVILGGSPFTTSKPDDQKGIVQLRIEAELSALLAEIRHRDFPFLGVCFGVGTMARAAGAIVDSTHREGTQAIWIELTDAGLHDPVFSALPARFESFVGHNEAIAVPPPHGAVLATSINCPVQGLRLGTNIYVTQFHPEMAPASLATRILAYRTHGYFPPEDAERLILETATVDVSASHRLLRAWVERYQ